MDEISFLLHGRRLRLSRQQVIDRLRDVEPETIQTWAAEVEGRPFPVKQVLAVAAGVSRGDFISHQARDLLIRLGFRVDNVRAKTNERKEPSEIAPVPVPEDKPPAATADIPTIKTLALNAAIAFYRGRTEATPEDVVKAAELYAAFLAGKPSQSRPRRSSK